MLLPQRAYRPATGDRPALGAGAPGLRALVGRRPPPQWQRRTGGGPGLGPGDRQAHHRGAARPGSLHLMAAYFAVPHVLRRGPAAWQTSPSAIRRGTRPPPPWTTLGQWHYVATRLMGNMGAYSPDEMNGLHWQWHQRAALRIRTAMQRHNVSDIPGSPGYQEHASGDRRPPSQEVPEPTRQAERRNSPERHQGPQPGMGSPSGTYRSHLRLFAPRRGQGSPCTSGVQGGTPERN